MNGGFAGKCPYFNARFGVDSIKITVVISDENLQGDGRDGEAPDDPQGSCISRVLFESEQPGQVDVEAFSSLGPWVADRIGSGSCKIAHAQIRLCHQR